MALKPTIYKTSLEISDIDRGYYETHHLTVACHPSETIERMMLRILIFALNADDRLEFGIDIGDTDEPALWKKDLTGAIDLWIEIGQPDEKSILRACGRAKNVIVYSYGRATAPWWGNISRVTDRAKNFIAYEISAKSAEALASLAERTMKLHCVINEGDISFGNDTVETSIPVLNLLKPQ